jgi:CxxC motif-containing protein (DUF1111 family)
MDPPPNTDLFMSLSRWMRPGTSPGAEYLSRRLRTLLPALVIPALAGLAACDSSPSLPDPIHGEVGDPLPGLSAATLDLFERGAAAFERQYTEGEGLGPRFNENSCDACHTFPVDGGTGETNIRRVSRTLGDGSCDPLTEASGGNLRVQVTEALAAAGGKPERDTSIGTHTAVFTIPFTFGLGLVDAIPLEVLEAMEDPNDADGDGISGRLGRDAQGRPARFGRKGDVASLADFVDGAFRMEMGLTTHRVPDEDQAGNPPGVPDGVDPAGEPEVSREDFEAVVAFLRFLAPPAPAAVDTPEEEEGRRFFQELGCAGCHVPVLPTAPFPDGSVTAAAVGLYSDLLLHDMGPGLEGTCTPAATNTEYRTEPLMGLRYRDRFLHDGRATRVMDAILAHGGEAEVARAAFDGLNRLQQESLLRFLGTL